MVELPPGYGLYADVLVRLGGEFRERAGGLSFSCPFPGHRHGDRNPSARAWVSRTRGGLMAVCFGCGARWKDFVEFVGLPVGRWFPDQGRKAVGEPYQPPKLVKAYPYRDAAGTLLYEKCRYEPKTFRVRRPLPERHRGPLGVPKGVAAWVWGLDEGEYGRHQEQDRGGEWNFRRAAAADQCRVTLPHQPKVLYRWPELVGADARQPVIYVEGEKSADALAGLGFVAVCGPGGASWWDVSLAAEFCDRRVTVIPDNDGPGYAHARLVAGSLLEAGAASIRLVGWSDATGLAAGADVWDFLAQIPQEKRKAAVVEVCRSAREWK